MKTYLRTSAIALALFVSIGGFALPAQSGAPLLTVSQAEEAPVDVTVSPGQYYAHVGKIVLDARADLTVKRIELMTNGDSRQIFDRLRLEHNGMYLGQAVVVDRYVTFSSDFVVPEGAMTVDVFGYIDDQAVLGKTQTITLMSAAYTVGEGTKVQTDRYNKRPVLTNPVTVAESEIEARPRHWQMETLVPAWDALILNFDTFAMRDTMGLNRVDATIAIDFPGKIPPAAETFIVVRLHNGSTWEILEEKNFMFDYADPANGRLIYRGHFNVIKHGITFDGNGAEFSIHVDTDDIYAFGAAPESITATVTGLEVYSTTTGEEKSVSGLPVGHTLASK